MILTSLQKLSSNVGDLGKIIVATSFEWLPKVQKIAQSGHTAPTPSLVAFIEVSSARRPSHQPTAYRSPTYSIMTITGSNHDGGAINISGSVAD